MLLIVVSNCDLNMARRLVIVVWGMIKALLWMKSEVSARALTLESLKLRLEAKIWNRQSGLADGRHVQRVRIWIRALRQHHHIRSKAVERRKG